MFARLLFVLLAGVMIWAVVARSSDGAARGRVYTVKPYDTLWSIAAAHYQGDPRDAVWRLRERNGLQGSLLRPGQRLVLP
jgi:LysM repeat protein